MAYVGRRNRLKDATQERMKKRHHEPLMSNGNPGFELKESNVIENGVLKRHTVLRDGDVVIGDQRTEGVISLSENDRLSVSVPAPVTMGNKRIGESMDITVEDPSEKSERILSVKNEFIDQETLNHTGKDVDELVVRLESDNFLRSGHLQLTGMNSVDIPENQVQNEGIVAHLNYYNTALGYGAEYRQATQDIWNKVKQSEVDAMTEFKKQEMDRGSKDKSMIDGITEFVKKETRHEKEVEDIVRSAAYNLSSRKTDGET